MFSLLSKGIKSLAAGNAQASLGLQSPHLPNAVTRIGRFLYTTSATWILIVWYTAYANQRTQPGSGPTLVLPGMPIVNDPDRPNRAPKFATAVPSSGGGQNAPGGSLAGVSGSLPGGKKAGGFLPRTAPYTPGRHDAGRDGQTTPGGPIIAPGAGRVLSILSDPGGFGPDYPVVRFTSGPYAGRTMYIGHTHSALHPGTTFQADQILSYTGRTPVGNATVPGWFEIGYAPGGIPGKIGQPAPF
jgi:hypothetical protein